MNILTITGPKWKAIRFKESKPKVIDPEESILPYLSYQVDSKSTFTLRDLVVWLAIGNWPIGEIFRVNLQKIFQDGEKKCKNPFKKLTVHTCYEFDKNNEIASKFHGVNGEMGKVKNYTISLSPTETFFNTPVVIAPNAETTIWDGNKKDWTFKTYKTMQDLTLYELLDALFNEICFHGYNEDKKKFSDELIQQSKDIESGKVKTYPMDEVFKRIRKKLGKKK